MCISEESCKSSDRSAETVADSAEDTLADSSEDAIADSAEDTLADSSEDAIADSAEDTLADSSEDVVADSAEDTLADSSADVVADSAEDTLADSAEDTLADSSEDTVAADSSEDITASVDTTAATDNSCWVGTDRSFLLKASPNSPLVMVNCSWRLRTIPLLTKKVTSSPESVPVTVYVTEVASPGLNIKDKAIESLSPPLISIGVTVKFTGPILSKALAIESIV